MFHSDHGDQAMHWAAKVRVTSEAKAPAFRFLSTIKEDVLAFEIGGVISSEEMPRVIEEFEVFPERHDRMRLLNRMKQFCGIDPSVFMQGGLVSMKLAALQKVERYAIVGAPSWMRKIVDAINPPGSRGRGGAGCAC